MPVPVVAVTRKTIPITRDYVGATERSGPSRCRPRSAATWRRAARPTAPTFASGDLLYRIDPRDFQAVLDQVKAQAQRDARRSTMPAPTSSVTPP